jgi:biotin carboxyl carrier protein
MPAASLAFFRSQGFREALAMAFRGAGRPAPGPPERFKAQAGHLELHTGSAQEKEVFHLEATADPSLFLLRGPALRRILEAAAAPHERGPALAAAAREAEPVQALRACRLGGAGMAVAVFGDTLLLEDPQADLARPRTQAAGAGIVTAPMGGKIIERHVAAGDAVEQGQLMFVLESMKMQFEITAPRAGTVAEVCVEAGQTLQGPETLAVLEPQPPAEMLP